MLVKNRLKSAMLQVTVRDIVEWHKNKKVYIDHRFQRNECWEKPDQKQYILSLVSGQAGNPFHMADIEECSQWCKEKEYKVEAAQFDTVKNYETLPVKLSLDGQNRGVAQSAYVNNEFSAVVDDSGENKYFKDLTDVEQEAFLDLPVYLLLYTGSTYSSLSDAFVGLNQGKPMNAMEKRNAIFTPVSDLVRQLPEVYPFIREVHSVTTRRMKDLDTVLKIICHVHSSQNEENFSDACLDKFYEIGRGKGDLTPYGKGFKIRVDNQLEWIQEVIRHRPKVFTPKKNKEGNVVSKMQKPVEMPHLWSICSVYNLIQKGKLACLRGMSLKSISKVIYVAHTEAETLTHQQYATDRQNAARVGDEDPKKTDYYAFAVTDVSSKAKRGVVSNELLAGIKNAVKRSSSDLQQVA
jgi:hypothetical protein